MEGKEKGQRLNRCPLCLVRVGSGFDAIFALRKNRYGGSGDAEDLDYGRGRSGYGCIYSPQSPRGIDGEGARSADGDETAWNCGSCGSYRVCLVVGRIESVAFRRKVEGSGIAARRSDGGIELYDHAGGEAGDEEAVVAVDQERAGVEEAATMKGAADGSGARGHGGLVRCLKYGWGAVRRQEEMAAVGSRAGAGDPCVVVLIDGHRIVGGIACRERARRNVVGCEEVVGGAGALIRRPDVVVGCVDGQCKGAGSGKRRAYRERSGGCGE